MLIYDEKYREYYTHKLPGFLSEIEPLGDFGYPWGLFLSHPLPEYGASGPKVFYIGRDTNGWHEYDWMMGLYKEGHLSNYIDKQWPTSPQDMMGWKNRMTFWTVVSKLHIYINHGIILPRLEDYTEEQKRCLMSLGFGNFNCIEVPASLQREGAWEQIDKEKYWIFKEKSRQFDRLKVILDLYEPDVVYLLSWVDDPVFLDGLKLHEDVSLQKDHWRCVYSVEGYKTTIIWTSHPTHFAHVYTQDVNTLVKFLGDTYLEL